MKKLEFLNFFICKITKLETGWLFTLRLNFPYFLLSKNVIKNKNWKSFKFWKIIQNFVQKGVF